MTLTKPPMPARFGNLFNETVTIRRYRQAIGDGGIGVTEFDANVATSQPCLLQVMSTSESQKYGSITDNTLYEVFLPTLSTDGADIRSVGAGTAWKFVDSGGTVYEALGAGVLVSDGMQKIPLRRVTGASIG